MAKQNADKQSGGQKQRRRDGGLTPGFIIIPAEIEALPANVLSSSGKRWYGYVYGFGAPGCWKSETKHATRYEVDERTVRRWSRTLEGLGEICRLNIQGKWGCVWALRSPEVQREEFLVHEGVGVRNPEYKKSATGKKPRTYRAGDPGHTEPETPDMGMQKPRTYMSRYYYNMNKSTIAAEPLPADGQAQRLKEEQRKVGERDTAIRGEFERRLPPRRHGDLKEAARRAAVYEKMNPKVVELMEGGSSITEAVERVYNENRKLVDGEG